MSSDLYERFAENGFGYGPAFQGIRTAWLLGDEVYAEVRLPEDQQSAAGDYGLHPALLDAALHSIAPQSVAATRRREAAVLLDGGDPARLGRR